MNSKELRTALQKLKGVLPLSVIVFFFSFTHFDPSIETGLDPSYAFGLNYIFAHHIPFGTDILYTYGPLGFLCFPQDIGSNFMLAVWFVSALRFLFIFTFIYLGSSVNKALWWLHASLALLICNWIYLDFVLIGATTCLLLIYQIKQTKTALVFAALITVIALLIKSSFGLMCASIAFSFSVYDAVKNKRLENALFLLASGAAFILLFWILLYGNINGVYTYFLGTWHLSSGNSSAMILEVENNWWLIALFISTFLALPFFVKEKGVWFLYSVSFLALYAGWKYAFSREENYHLKFFFDYLLVFSALVLIVTKTYKSRHIALLLTSLFLFYQSMKATGMYTIDEELSLSGIKNAYELLFDAENFRNEARFRTQQNLQNKKLPNEMLKQIGNNTIDFFPWELTYAAANNLNWKPRPNLQSGAYTPWLDSNNANFISSARAPEFYLWEMNKPGGGVDCFDGRYLLNDEPHTILALLMNYQMQYSDSMYTLFQKKQTQPQPLIVEGEKMNYTWNKWIKVPDDTTTIIRVKTLLKNNTIGKLRKAIYKDILYFIDYKLRDGKQKSFRIVRENAINGLWVSPLIERINSGLKGKKVDFVRFRSSNSNLVDAHISVQWQIITLAENQQVSKNGK